MLDDRNKELEESKSKINDLQKKVKKSSQVKKLKAVNPYQIDDEEDEETKDEATEIAQQSNLIKELQEKQRQTEMKVASNQHHIQ